MRISTRRSGRANLLPKSILRFFRPRWAQLPRRSVNTRRQRPLPTLNLQKRPPTSRRSPLPEPACRQLPRKITQISSTFRSNGDVRKDTFQEGVVSSQDHDIAKAIFDAAQAQLESDRVQIIDAATRNIQSAQAQAVAVRAQLGAAVAQLGQAKATVAQAQVNLNHTRIVAPSPGRSLRDTST